MKRQALIVLGIAAAIGVPAALANHVPNDLYQGTHSNGGAVTMKLAANGGLQLFRAADLKLGGSCPASMGFTLTNSFPLPT